MHRNKFLFNKANRRTNFPNLFCQETLNVSGSSSAHHQEFSTVHSALVYVMQVWWHITVPNVQWKETPIDGQRNCPKHVGFLDKSKFGKLVRVLVLLKRKRNFLSYIPGGFLAAILPCILLLSTKVVTPQFLSQTPNSPIQYQCTVWLSQTRGFSGDVRPQTFESVRNSGSVDWVACADMPVQLMTVIFGTAGTYTIHNYGIIAIYIR